MRHLKACGTCIRIEHRRHHAVFNTIDVTLHLIQVKAASKKINYEALRVGVIYHLTIMH